MALSLSRRLASGYRAKMLPGAPRYPTNLPGIGAGLGAAITSKTIMRGGNPFAGGKGRVKAATIGTTFATPGQPMYADWDGAAATEKGYLGHGYVMRCVRLRAETVAGLDFHAGPDPDNPSVFNPDSPLVKLLGASTPQAPGGPNVQMTARAFWIWTICQRIITGKMAWEYQFAEGKGSPITGLWPLVAAAISPVPGEPGAAQYFSGYVYKTPLADIPLGLDECFYDWRPSAKDPRQPESVLQSATMPIQVAIACDRYMWGLLSKGMVASKLVITPDYEEEGMRRAWEDQFNAEFTGYDNAGKVLFAYADNDFDPNGKLADQANVQVIDLSMKSVDAQLLEMVKQAKLDVEVAIGVPESIIGNASQRIFSNADAEYRNFWTTTAVNDVAELQDGVNLRLAPLVSPTEAGWFDLSRVAALQPPTVFQPPAITDAINAGIVTPEQASNLLGIPAISAAGEDVETVPIGEEAAGTGVNVGAGTGGRSGDYRRLRPRGLRSEHAEVIEALSDSLPDGWGFRYRPLTTHTLRAGNAGWGIVRVPRQRLISGGRRAAGPQPAPAPALCAEIEAKVAISRGKRARADRVAELEAEVASLRAERDFDAWFADNSARLEALVP